MAIATLAADSTLTDCLRSLEEQTIDDFEVVVVDNSGEGRAREAVGACRRAILVENPTNVGFGAAINQVYRSSGAPFLATLNDDAVADPKWLEALLTQIQSRADIGMCASQVRLADPAGRLDSAGMLIARDGSSKQRGHGESPEKFSRGCEVMAASGSAAIYRRDMLEEIGLFDESFFLYCEDTDLGLRARWAAWECRYVPEALVTHGYSHSAGKASRLKAYHVERNRLFLVVKNFPAAQAFASVFFAGLRYFWHLVSVGKGKGKAAEFRNEGGGLLELAAIVVRAHLAAIGALPRLLRERRRIRRRLVPRQFRRMLASYSIAVREVAAL